MDQVKAGCPSDTTLEMYLYKDLPYSQMIKVRAHLIYCSSCRNRLLDLRRFNSALSDMSFEEPPIDLADSIVKSMDGWGDPTPVAVPDADDDQVAVRTPSATFRWAMGAVMLVISMVVQWQLGDRLPGFLTGGYLTGLKGIGDMWKYLVSGAWWQGTLQVIEAVRTDGIGALEIVWSALLTEVAGVLVFGGIVTAVFVSQIRASREKREGHHR